MNFLIALLVDRHKRGCLRHQGERLLLLPMRDNELNITSHVFLYNEFVHKMEKDYGHLDSWLNMEILNALALDEWEMLGKPEEWNVWKDAYQEKALNLVRIFLNESGLSCH